MSEHQAEPLDPMGWVKRESESELEAKAAKRAARRKTGGELRRLSLYLASGGELVGEDVAGIGTVYRAKRVCTVAPFSSAAVEKWCAREGRPLPDNLTARSDATITGNSGMNKETRAA